MAWQSLMPSTGGTFVLLGICLVSDCGHVCVTGDLYRGVLAPWLCSPSRVRGMGEETLKAT